MKQPTKKIPKKAPKKRNKKKEDSSQRISRLLITLVGGLFFVMAFSLGILYERRDDSGTKKLDPLLINRQKLSGHYSFFDSLTKKEEKPVRIRKNRSKEEIKNKPLDKKQPDKKQFLLQVFSFRSKKTADEIAADFEKAGYPAFTQAVDLEKKGIWHRVMIGHYTSYEEAQKVRDTIYQEKNIQALIISEK
ncbi:MAG: SPOR domain-containing protein [bacterium]